MSGYNLLNVNANAKTVKNLAGGYLTGILYLSAGNTSGYEVCPFRTDKCTDLCYGHTAGRMPMRNVQAAQIRKTRLFFENRPAFFALLEADLHLLVAQAKRDGMKPAVRLNGASDIRWNRFPIIGKFPDVVWYDYTKFPPTHPTVKNLPANYRLTYSWNEGENAAANSLGWAKRGINTAIVYYNGLPAVINDSRLPAHLQGLRVVDGDETDLRFADPKNCVIGLKAKGPVAIRMAKENPANGFVIPHHG